jgi:hypothetical protein
VVVRRIRFSHADDDFARLRALAADLIAPRAAVVVGNRPAVSRSLTSARATYVARQEVAQLSLR